MARSYAFRNCTSSILALIVIAVHGEQAAYQFPVCNVSASAQLLPEDKCCNSCTYFSGEMYATFHVESDGSTVLCTDPILPALDGCPGFECRCNIPFTVFDQTFNSCTTFGLASTETKPWCEVDPGCGTEMIGPNFGRYWSTDYCPSNSTQVGCLTLVYLPAVFTH